MRQPRMLKVEPRGGCRAGHNLIRMVERFGSGLRDDRSDDREDERSASNGRESTRRRVSYQEAISLRGRYGEPRERGE